MISAEFLGSEILNLVDEQCNRGLAGVGRFADRHEQGWQVDLQIAAIGRSGFRFDVQPDREIIDLDLECADESPQNGERAFDLHRDSGHPVQVVQQVSQVRGDHHPERFVVVCFDRNRAIVFFPGESLNFVQ